MVLHSSQLCPVTNQGHEVTPSAILRCGVGQDLRNDDRQDLTVGEWARSRELARTDDGAVADLAAVIRRAER
jgi:hypothetical protein